MGTPDAFNTTRDDCKWKYGNERDSCPDPDIKIIMYTTSGVNGKNRGRLAVSLWPSMHSLPYIHERIFVELEIIKLLHAYGMHACLCRQVNATVVDKERSINYLEM